MLVFTSCFFVCQADLPVGLHVVKSYLFKARHLRYTKDCLTLSLQRLLRDRWNMNLKS